MWYHYLSALRQTKIKVTQSVCYHYFWKCLKLCTPIEAWIQTEKNHKGGAFGPFFPSNTVLSLVWSFDMWSDTGLWLEERSYSSTDTTIEKDWAPKLEKYPHLWKLNIFFYFLKWKWKIGGGGQEEDMRKSGPTSFPVSFSKPRNYSHFWKLDKSFLFITWNWEMRGRGKEGDVRKSGPTDFQFHFINLEIILTFGNFTYYSVF